VCGLLGALDYVGEVVEDPIGVALVSFGDDLRHVLTNGPDELCTWTSDGSTGGSWDAL
jgi:hypothetical protein